jgi:hypothetical protein
MGKTAGCHHRVGSNQVKNITKNGVFCGVKVVEVCNENIASGPLLSSLVG